MKVQVTIKDIARKLNISPSTVSRALKNHPDISEKTKKEVKRLASELDYKPNSVALSLRSSKTYTVGVIIPEIAHHFFSTVISGIEAVAYNNGYKVVIAQSNESYEREVLNTEALYSSRVDGMLVSVSKETEDFSHFKDVVDRGLPVVFFDRTAKGLDTSQIVVDDHDGAFQAVEHLIKMGYKRIAHLSGPKALTISEQRLQGYKDALAKYGLPYDEKLVIPTALSMEEGIANTITLLDRDERPDAIFAVTDPVAMGVLTACKQRGVKIPGEIGVIGFSGEPITSLVEPSLSTVSQPGFEMGQLAAMEILRMLKEGKENFQPQKKELKSELIVRNSTKRS
jgi:LacI family transcriptional regulator